MKLSTCFLLVISTFFIHFTHPKLSDCIVMPIQGSATTSHWLEPESNNCDSTFLKAIGTNGKNESGYTIIDGRNGSLYLGGSENDKTLLMKLSKNGDILWSYSFDVSSAGPDILCSIMLDTDEKILGCGYTSVGGLAGGNPYIFKFDPDNQTLLWVNSIFVGSTVVRGMIDMGIGKNLLILSNTDSPNNAQLIEVSKNTGALVSSNIIDYNLGAAETFNDGVILNNFLYVGGRYTDGGSFAEMRTGITKFDLSNFSQVWTSISHINSFATARLYCQDLIIDNNAIFTASSGDDDGTSVLQTNAFFQKTDLNGNIQWVKKYDVLNVENEFLEEIVALPDGFLLYGRTTILKPSSDLIVIKVNKQGDVLWSKRIDYQFSDNMTQFAASQSKCINIGDYYYFTAATDNNTATNSDILLFKMNKNGEINDTCKAYIKNLEVVTTTISNPTSDKTSLSEDVIFASEIKVQSNLNKITDFKFNDLCPCIECNDIILEENITICEGQNYKGYTKTGIYEEKYLTTLGCDSTVKVNLLVNLLQVRNESISFCAGKSVTIAGQSYTQSGTVTETRAGKNGACDTTITYDLTVLPLQVRNENISFCAGKSVTIAGQSYTQAGIVTETRMGKNGACDTIINYTLTVLPTISRSETKLFCPGSSINIGGQVYTQPGSVTEIKAGKNGGCDTLVTYTLRFSTPAPSNVTVKCPGTISVITSAGGTSTANFPLPTASTNCICPGLDLKLTKGLPSGSTFQAGNTEICYEATDVCGNKNNCCFTVFVREAGACDIKEIGCVKYELLTITADSAQNLTYRIRVTNKCPNKLIYTAIQLPEGVIALNPKEMSVFNSESSGYEYDVRNPNFTPFYSIRFKSTKDSISGGQSEIFRYKLPAQAIPKYIQITSRLSTQEFYPAYLNTFYCPIGVTPPGENRTLGRSHFEPSDEISLFPNPTTGDLNADFSAWDGKQVTIRILNIQGQLIQMLDCQASKALQFHLDLPKTLPSGVYVFEASTQTGDKVAIRFFLER